MPKIKTITENSSPEDKEKVVMDLIHWLDTRDLFHDIRIYCNNKCWSSYYYPKNKMSNKSIINDPRIARHVFYEETNITASDYIEYANDNLITMSFEGSLNHELNYGNGRTEQELIAFFAKRGLYFELGYSWSLSTYEN